MEVNIAPAEAIQGWMLPEELAQLAEWAAQHERIVEIGSHVGRSTRVLADHTKGFVLAVDHWCGEYNEVENRFEKFKTNVSDAIESGKVKVFLCDSLALPDVDIGFVPDMVFIDGDHSKAVAGSDMRWALSVLPSGGLICGHDAEIRDIDESLHAILTGWKREAGYLWSFRKAGP